MHDIGNTLMEVLRVNGDGSLLGFEIMGDYDGPTYVFNYDADVEIGDVLSHTLGSGKKRIVRIEELHEIGASGYFQDAPYVECYCEVVQITPLSGGGRAEPRSESPRIDIRRLHPSVLLASQSQMTSGHFNSAVFEAFKAVEHRVQQLSASPHSGKPLMASVFNEQSPSLDISSDNVNDAQRADEQEGFKFLFMGAAQALRNPRAHGADVETAEQEAMEMLVMASLLMRALDRAERRLQQPRHLYPVRESST